MYATPIVGQSSSLISRGEALAAVFPDADIKLERIFLTENQVERIEALSRVDVHSKLYVRFIASQNGELIGRAYADTHIVRSKRETLLVSVRPDGTIIRIDVTAFIEPPQYTPAERWLEQYADKHPDDDDVDLGRAVRPILGATLTARAVNSAVKRVQALDAVLEGKDSARQP